MSVLTAEQIAPPAHLAVFPIPESLIMESEKPTLSNFDKVEKIGEGTFG